MRGAAEMASKLVHNVVIDDRRKFEELFNGFTKLCAISYVVTPALLLEFFDKRGYREIELLVGEGLTAETYRQGLKEKGVQATQRLAERVEDGTLQIYFPNKVTVHSKFYILEGDSSSRVIVSSANLTETAHQASRQINYAWYRDVSTDDPWLHQYRQDYRAHFKNCQLFMGDLMQLLHECPESDKSQVVEAWLRGTSADEENAEVRSVLQEASGMALRDEPIVSLRLPEPKGAKERIKRWMARLKPEMSGNELLLNGAEFIRYVQENYQFPLMRVDVDRGEILLGMNGTKSSRTEPLPDPAVVNLSLQHIEDYVNMVDFGKTTDLMCVKMSMFEALLYGLSAPFANEYMKVKQIRLPLVERRGPLFLYIYGPAQNGKTTFFEFVSKLLTGYVMRPLKSTDFTQGRIDMASTLGTAFPLMFDDVNPGSRHVVFESIVKSHWESEWTADYVRPQIMISSNTPKLKEWAKSRVKRIDFDVQFTPNRDAKERLQKIFDAENQLFKWFSHLYLGYLGRDELLSEDQLQVSRLIMRELYDYAQRDLPGFFPERPIEESYDSGRRTWQELVSLSIVEFTRQKGSTLIHFKRDVPIHEINDYRGCLPQSVKHHQRGSTLIMETPDEFEAWIQDGKPKHRSWFQRLGR